MAGTWLDRAACRPGQGIDPDLFFPVGTNGPALLQIIDAKFVCAGCPVRWECLDDALNAGPIGAFGVAGGMSEDERRALRRDAA